MRALILAAGRGHRVGELTGSTNKCMLPLLGKPILEYNLARAAEVCEEIILVVGQKAEEIINRFGIDYAGKRIRYVIQSEQKGLVHAIECAGEALEDEDFFLLLGDEVLLNSRHKLMVNMFDEDIFGICGVLRQRDQSKIRKTYAVLTDGQERILRLIEKPKRSFNDWQGTGHCVLRNEILSYTERTPIHPERGEKELPDLIQCAIDAGGIVELFDVCDGYTNINSGRDLVEAQQIIQGEMKEMKVKA